MRTKTEWIQYFNSKRGEVFSILHDIHMYSSKVVIVPAGTNVIILKCYDWRASGVATGTQLWANQDDLLSFEVLLADRICNFRMKVDGLKIL